MSYNLFLDDIRDPKDCYYYTRDEKYLDLDWIVVRSFDEFRKSIFDNGIPILISFDHDLSSEQYAIETNSKTWQEYYNLNNREMTGYDCAKFLCEYCMENKKEFPKFMVHSFNTVGVENIITYIKNYKKIIEQNDRK